jgi:outer membrane protein OmpA-like peptidoglycan-associated protein
MVHKGFYFIVSISLFGLLSVSGQQVIKLQNPSFEDIPRKGGEFSGHIRDWHDCGLTKFQGETPPDIHPVPSNAWEVSKDSYDGETYLGMVVRYNDTWESLSQALSSPIQGGKCYSFSVFLAKSELYKSRTTRSNEQLENFDRPAVLLIWGGNHFCHTAELLGESPGVSNTDWKQFNFLFQPKRTYTFITIEAFYKTPILEAYNGHVLVDGMSDIVQTDCPLFPRDIIAEVSDPPVKVEVAINSGSNSSHSSSSGNAGGASKGTIKSGTISSPPKTFKPVLITELQPGKVYVGQKIRLNHLYFKADSVNLLPDSYKVLDELAEFLKVFPKTVIEIGGHTNTIPPEDYCNHLSTERAKAVQVYLISQGVPAARLKYKGYGKSDPIIAYDKFNREARIKNQRVEIKILSVTG